MTDAEWEKEWTRLRDIAMQAGVFVTGSAGLSRYRELYKKMKRDELDWEAGCWAWEQALKEAGVFKTAVEIEGDEYEEAMRGIEIMERLG